MRLIWMLALLATMAFLLASCSSAENEEAPNMPPDENRAASDDAADGGGPSGEHSGSVNDTRTDRQTDADGRAVGVQDSLPESSQALQGDGTPKPMDANNSGGATDHYYRLSTGGVAPPVNDPARGRRANWATGAQGATTAEAREPMTDGEQYEHYGENELVTTAVDPLSTFAIDVDTASYTIMRNDILDRGTLPNEAGVRVEEYVNYFDYGYAPPSINDEHPFKVHLEAAPSPFREGRQLVRVGIKGYEVPELERTPANLVFLVDVSGSMSAQNKLPLVKHSLELLTERLTERDTISIVTYASGVRIALEPTSLGEAKSSILASIDALRSGGSTAGAAGLRTAYDVAQRSFIEGGINRIVLCTDGDFNVGMTGQALRNYVSEQRDRGVEMSLFLFGRGNINDADMQEIANSGDGNYAFIDTKSEATRALGDKLVGTLQTIAKDVKIQVEFDPEVVTQYRLIGYESRDIADEDFRNDKVDAGELGAGHSVTAFYEVVLADGAADRDDANLATVRLRYKKPSAAIEDPAMEVMQMLPLAELQGSFDGASDGFRFGAAVCEYAQIMRGSQFVDEPAFAALLDIADATAGDDPDRLEFIGIAAAASDIPELYKIAAEDGTTEAAEPGATN